MDFDDHPWLVECSRAVDRARRREDERAVMDACWTLGARIARAVLRQMGEKPPADATVLDQLTLSQELAKGRQDRFPGVPHSGLPWLELPRLYRAMWWIEESRKSGNYGTLPEGSPYRYRDHLSISVLDAAIHLIAAMRPREQPQTTLDVMEGYAIVEDEVLADRGVSQTMESVIGRLRTMAKSSIWSRLSRLAYAKEAEAYRPFLTDLTRREPPPFRIHGLWFGIAHPIRDGRATTDAYVFGSDNYDLDDEEWAERAEWEPRGGDLHSAVLAKIDELGRRPDAPSLASDFVALAYTCLLARELTRAYKRDAALERIGAGAGYDDGDIVHLGWL